MSDTVENFDEAIDTIQLVMTQAHEGMRLDKSIAELCPDYSRTRLQTLIDNGECLVNGQTCKTPSRKIEIGDVIMISIPALVDANPEPENIPIDVVYEDNDLLVINKPVGMVVHPAVGNHTGTLVNALLYHCGDTLSGINGVKRPGIVHRLDKDTSGLMIVAKNDLAHHHLSEQLQDRSLSRVYLALVFGIGRHPSNRLKMAVVEKGGKEAATNYSVRDRFADILSLVECHLESGRTHQIRVHMEHLGFPLIGDQLYGVQANKLKSRLKKAGYEEDVQDRVVTFPHQALHATEISFIHPRTEEEMSFSCDLPRDFADLIADISSL
jgi:23S rRNA pseudouridine1911/1915/1917 synthase